MRVKSLMLVAAGIVGGGTLAVGSVAVAQSGDEAINACVSDLTGVVRIVDADAGCRVFEHEEEWSKTGPQGPAGPAGPEGQQGPAGPQGPPGVGEPEAQAAGVLLVDGVQGGSIVELGAVDALSVADGITVVPPAGGGGGGGAGKANFADLSVAVLTDKAQPELNVTTASGTHIRDVVLRLCTDLEACTATSYLTYELEDVLITGIATSAGGGQPTTQLSLNFGKIIWEYRFQNPDGSFGTVKAGWDVKANKEL